MFEFEQKKMQLFYSKMDKNNYMSTINFDGSCANCRRKPVAFGIPVLKNPAVEGQGGHNIDIWCIDCVRRLLHQGEDEVVVGG